MKPITAFTGATGLNIVEDPVRIPAQRDGKSDLQVAINVSIDQSYRVNSRRGVTQLQSGNFHSLFCDGGDCFVVKGDSLYQVAADGSLTGIRSGLTEGARMDYAQVGDWTYYVNGFEKGIIQGGISSVWGEGSYFGPTTNRHFSGPVPGHHIAQFDSRILISQDNVLWWSEPFNFDLFNQAESFVQFHTKILMIKPVEAGVFVSTSRNTYFLEGKLPKKWVARKVAGYPAVEWTDAIDYITAADLGFEAVGGCAVWASKEGAIMGFPSGQIANLNKRKVIYPETAMTGFGGLIGFNYIHGVK